MLTETEGFIIGIVKEKEVDVQFLHLSRRIILFIELPWPANPVNTFARRTETLDSFFDFIRSQLQCILWSPSLEIETLSLIHQSTSHTSDAELISHGNCAAN